MYPLMRRTPNTDIPGEVYQKLTDARHPAVTACRASVKGGRALGRDSGPPRMRRARAGAGGRAESRDGRLP
jgi:hypothetical protein